MGWWVRRYARKRERGGSGLEACLGTPPVQAIHEPPEGVDGSKIDAEFVNGLLEISIEGGTNLP